MLSAVLNAAPLVQVDDLSDDDSGFAAGPAKAAHAPTAAPAPTAKIPKPKVGKEPGFVCKKPSAKCTMKRPAAASTLPPVATEKPEIKAWKCKYHKHNMFGIKLQIGKQKVTQVLTASGTKNLW